MASHDDNIGPMLQEVLLALDQKKRLLLEQGRSQAGMTDGVGNGLPGQTAEGSNASAGASDEIGSDTGKENIEKDEETPSKRQMKA